MKLWLVLILNMYKYTYFASTIKDCQIFQGVMSKLNAGSWRKPPSKLMKILRPKKAVNALKVYACPNCKELTVKEKNLTVLKIHGTDLIDFYYNSINFVSHYFLLWSRTSISSSP